jgi:tetratricopeptide (TPR) repeat protein
MASEALRRSPRLRQFLSYVVRHVLAGDEDGIKEHTIGVEVFQRGTRFDPKCDSIVRVEAIKLRRRLHEYYRSEGATDLVTISIPKGSYRPIFHIREETPAAMFDDPENVCAQAESLLLQCTAHGVHRARRYLHRAIERWPQDADLQVALASTTVAALEIECMSPDEGVPVLRRSARRALVLDATRGDARFLAQIADIRRQDKSAVIQAAHEALRLTPTSAIAHFRVASVVTADNRMRDALIHLNLAVRLQPYALLFQTWRAVVLFCTGQQATGRRHLRDILEFEPDDYLANYCLGLVAARVAQYDEARQAATHAYELSRSNQALGQLGYVEAQAGHVEAAEAILEQLTVTARTEYVARSWLGAIHLALGRLDRAAAEVRRAWAEGDWELGWASSDPRWDPLRGKIGGL